MPELNVVEAGAGRPLLALHGLGPDHRQVAGMLEPVLAGRPGYRRIYPDLPGFGGSPAGEVTDTAELVDIIEHLIDQRIGEQRFALAGQSYGGYLAAELARRRPDQIAGLALICPLVIPQFADRVLPPHQVLVRDPDATDGLDLAERVQFETSTVVQTPQTLARFTAELASGLALHDAVAATRLLAGGHALPASPYREPAPDCPVLIVTGRQDAIVGYADHWQLARHYRRASFAVLDTAGHAAQLERPALIDALLTDWLERIPANRW